MNVFFGWLPYQELPNISSSHTKQFLDPYYYTNFEHVLKGTMSEPIVDGYNFHTFG